MERLTLEDVLAGISQSLRLSKEDEQDILAEIRSHLEAAVDQARARGEDEQAALIAAAGQFGGAEVGAQLQQVHAGREMVDALAVTALPVLFTLILRWLVFAPDGSALDWPQMFVRPAFWVVAGAALLLPSLYFRRWRMALVGWGLFWLLSVIFVVFPTLR